MRVRSRTTVIAAIAAALLLGAASCGSTDDTTATPTGATSDVSVLGPVNRASDTPIRIGFVHDGKSAAIDQTAVAEAFQATVDYVNEHLGGLNGHPLEVTVCSTNNVPTDATNCGVQLVSAGVAAVLVPVSAQDGAIFGAVNSAGIPYITYNAGTQEIMVKPNAFLLVNPVGLLAGPARVAKDNGVKRAGIIIIDVPAASGPAKAFATPMYANKGMEVEVVPISPQTADLTPQIQQAMSTGIEQFSIIGPDEFNASAIKALQQLGFDGRIVMVTAPSQAIADGVPNGLGGITYVTSASDDPDDPEVQRYQAVLQQYAPGTTPIAQSAWAYATVLGFVKALDGNAASVDGPSISQALGSMPAPLDVPLGGGLTFQCGAKVVPIVPNVCAANVLVTELDAEGRAGDYSILDITDYLSFG